jgi:hypothetical protein
MPDPDYKALCAELADSVELLLEMRSNDRPMRVTEDRLDRARAALAQPEPEPVAPSKHELFSLLMHVGGATQCVSIGWLEPFADAVLARWGRPASKSE